MTTPSIGGSASRATPGATQRRGPTPWIGDAYALQTGSISRFWPPIWTRNEECPIQVSTRSSAPARGTQKVGVARGCCAANARGSIEGRLSWLSRRQRRKAPKPCSCPAGHGFWKPPPGRWWLDVTNYLNPTSTVSFTPDHYPRAVTTLDRRLCCLRTAPGAGAG